MFKLKIIYILFILFFVASAQAQTSSACGASQPENCITEFLSTDQAVEVPAPPFYCEGKRMPAEWGCKNPVNHANQATWCYCENGYDASEALFKQALSNALPSSIPVERFEAVMGTMTEEEKQRSLAVRDWHACGHTVDWLVSLLLNAK